LFGRRRVFSEGERIQTLEREAGAKEKLKHHRTGTRRGGRRESCRQTNYSFSANALQQR
jgi:hypothetical protein